MKCKWCGNDFEPKDEIHHINDGFIGDCDHNDWFHGQCVFEIRMAQAVFRNVHSSANLAGINKRHENGDMLTIGELDSLLCDYTNRAYTSWLM